MPIYKSTDGIAKINTTSTIFRGAEIVFGSGLFVSASGGNITTDGDYKIHTFSTPGTSSFIIESIASPNNLNSVEYLIQGAGGSGGRLSTGFGAAGGAGGIQSGSFTILSTTYEVIVGEGGGNPGGTNYNGEEGETSSIFGITACSGSGGENTASGGGNCDFNGWTGNGAGASNIANATISNLGPSGSLSSISGTSIEYGRGGDTSNVSPTTGIKGQGGHAGSGLSIDSGVGGNGVVIVRYQYQ
jgi:hypothetical protein